MAGESSQLRLDARWCARKGASGGDVDAYHRLAEDQHAVCSPGVGVVGLLFSDSRDRDWSGNLPWHSLHDLVLNPDLPTDARTRDAAAVFPFALGLKLHYSYKVSDETPAEQVAGVLILFVQARADDDVNAPLPPCQRRSGAPYLRSFANTLAAVLQATALQKAHLHERRAKAARAWRLIRFIVKTGFLSSHLRTMPVASADATVTVRVVAEDSDRRGTCELCCRTLHFCRATCVASIRRYARKMRGTGADRHPPASWSESAWAGFGSTITLFIVSIVNKQVGVNHKEYFFMISSFGAVCTLLFALPNSPVTQPR